MIERSLFFRVVVIGWLLTAVIGCSSANKDPRCYPVTGKVTFKGKPAQFAVVSFIPADTAEGRMPAAGVVDEFGEFRLLTQKRIEGAQSGKYLVKFTFRIPGNPGTDDAEYGRELLPKKYLDTATSGYEFTVEPTENDVPPFALTP